MHTFPVPRCVYWRSTPYTVQFSPDGTTLAVGTGSCYGEGAVALIDVARGESRTLRFSHPNGHDLAGEQRANHGTLSVSGVCFDDVGRYLAISTRTGNLRHSPTLLYRVHGLELEEVQAYDPVCNSQTGFSPSYGLCFSPGRLHVRRQTPSQGRVFVTYELPPDVDSGGLLAWRAHAGITTVGGRVVTSGLGAIRVERTDTPHTDDDYLKAEEGLVFGPAPLRSYASPVRRISAIVTSPAGQLYTGGHDGEIHAWACVRDIWKPVCVLTPGEPKPKRPEVRWSFYRPQSVVGLCCLDANRLCSVDADGEVCVWRDDQCELRFRLPGPGTPRTLAWHPDTPLGPLLAVGVKGPDGVEEGMVLCVSLRSRARDGRTVAIV